MPNETFLAEEQLCMALLNTLKRRYRLSSRECHIEFESPNGIADLVIANLQPDWSSKLAIGTIRPEWAYALLHLPNSIFCLEDFVAISGVSKPTARKVLAAYVSSGYCTYDDASKSWFRIVCPQPLTSQLCAIEVKLRKWRRALYQASRYQDFAHQAWVVLDDKYIAPALTNLSEFRRLNVGLATLAINGELKIYSKPYLRDPRSCLRFWHANAVIASRLRVENTI